MSIQNGIQHPDIFFSEGPSWKKNYKWCNLWSMNSTTQGLASFNDNAVVKTIYDPCPAGFKMPASNAFTSFSKNGQAISGGVENFNGRWDGGWFFNNRLNNPDATIYFIFPPDEHSFLP